jgi:hypothetical protein
MGPEVSTCTPTPIVKGRYAVSRSFLRQPSRKVSRVKMSVVKPATLARCETESVTSSFHGLFARNLKKVWGKRKGECTIVGEKRVGETGLDTYQ